MVAYAFPHCGDEQWEPRPDGSGMTHTCEEKNGHGEKHRCFCGFEWWD